jgi:hypothetical protein
VTASAVSKKTAVNTMDCPMVALIGMPSL